MEQKKKKEEDVLVVRDEKTGEISVVAGLDGKGYPKTTPPKAEHSQEFLRFDRHGDAIDNFFRNFYRQCKEPTRFGFYRVAAETAEALLPVIKDLLKDPVANADMLAPHKVETSKYQQAEGQQTTEEVKKENAEMGAEGQQAAEEVKRESAGTDAAEHPAEEAKRENAETDSAERLTGEDAPGNDAKVENDTGVENGQKENGEMEDAQQKDVQEDNIQQQKEETMENLKQKQHEGQTQTAAPQEGQGQPHPTQTEKPGKANLIADGDVDWAEMKRYGVDREKLTEKDLKALMNYGKTGLVNIKPDIGGETFELQARLSLRKDEGGKLRLVPHFVRAEAKLDVPHKGYTFSDEDRKKLKQTGNLGKTVDVADTRTGEMRPSYISIDRLTNEIVDIPAEKVRIPNRIGETALSKEEQDILRAGLALPKEVTLKNGRKFEAVLQVSAEKRDVEFVPEHLWQGQSQRRGNGQEKKQKSPEAPDTPGQQQKEDGNQENGQRRNRSWTNEDGSIRPISKWKDDKFTEQQKADYVAGKVVVLANAKDDKGQPCTKYLKFDREKGRPMTYPENPDLAQTVAPSNESRTQLAVNNEGKTNEATRHVKEPLSQGQTAPKDAAQQKQQEKPKKGKGVKVS